jgi:hypothetical protein
MKRLVTLLLANLTTLLVFASVALADSQNDHGEGWFGETSDWDITVAGFILIAGFPTFLLIASLIMWRLDKRKDLRKSAAKARAARADSRGGW